MRSNWTALTTWKTTDDPTGVLTGRVLIAEGDIETPSIELVTEEIGSNTAFSINHYESFVDYAFQEDWQFNAGVFGLISRATYSASEGVGAYYMAGFSVRKNQLEILKFNGVDFECLAKAKLDSSLIRREYLHSMSFKTIGTESVSLELKIDGKLVLTASDISSTKLTSGLAGLFVQSGTIYADTFYINRFTVNGEEPVGWTPTSLGSNLNAWFSTSDKTTSGSNVTAWNDISGDLNNSSPLAADKQPLFVSNLQNNLEGVQIRTVTIGDVVSATPLIVSASTTLDMQTTGVSIFAVLKSTDMPSDGVSQIIVKKGNSYHLSVKQGEVNFYNGTNYGDDGSVKFGTSELVLAGIVTDKDSAATAHGGIFLNGSKSKGLTGIGPSANNDINMSIGSDLSASTTTDLVGSIGEIIIYKGELSIGDRQKVEGFLCHKWAIQLPTNHPYYSEAPKLGD